MGVLNEIFIADEPGVLDLTAHELPLNKFPGIEAPGIDVIKLATLSTILKILSFDEAIEQQELVRTFSEEEGPWVTRVPDKLRDALAKLSDDESRSVAGRWAQTEEFGGCPEAEVYSFLQELARLAREATTLGKSLFDWTSL